MNDCLFIKRIKDRFKELCKEENGILFFLINIFIVALIIIIYPYIPFLAYMKYYGIYSYDFFTNSKIAIYMFGLSILLTSIIISVAFTFGGIDYIFKKVMKKKLNKSFLLFNGAVFFIFVILLVISKNKLFNWFLFIYVYSTLISLQISIYKHFYLTKIKMIIGTNVIIMCFFIPYLYLYLYFFPYESFIRIYLHHYYLNFDIIIYGNQYSSSSHQRRYAKLI